MASVSNDEADEFAGTFAPDTHRPAAPRSDYMWMVGVVLVLAALAILVSAWFAFQRSLLSSGPFAMRRSPGLTIDQIRDRNRQAAPFVALSSLPLLVAGAWMIATKPPRDLARAGAVVAAVLFAVILAVTSATL